MALREREDDHLPLPNGWFAVAWSKELSEGDVKPVHYFGLVGSEGVAPMPGEPHL